MKKFASAPLRMFSLAVVVILIPVAMRMSIVASSPATLPPSNTDVASTLIRAGLDPEALATGGVSTSQAGTVVDDFAAAMSAEASRLASADARYEAAKVTSDKLRRLIQSGRGDQDDVSSYQTAMADLKAAEGDRQSTLDDWFKAGVAGLSGAQVSTLQTIRGNRHWKLPPELLVLDRSEAEWVQLRDALAHERIAAKYGETVDPTVQAYLASERSNPAVSAATTYSSTNLAAVEAAWTTAIE